MKNRDQWIDKAKAIGIIFVVLGHHKHFLREYLYTFHMPLFFFISGYLFNREKYPEFKKYFFHKVKTIVIPYFIFAFLLFGVWIFIGKFLDPKAIEGYSFSKNFIGIFYSQGRLEYMKWGVELWFLLCLFVTSILFYFISKYGKKNIVILLGLFATAGAFYISYSPFRLPWNIDTSAIALVFYGTGYLLKDNIKSLKNNLFFISLILLVLFINLIFFYLNVQPVDMYMGIYNNYLYFFLSAIGGVLFYFFISKFIPDNKVIGFIGVNSIIFYLLHMRALTVINFLFYKVFKISLPDNSLWVALLFTFIQFLILVPAVFIINRYLPFMIGKTKAKSL